MNKNNILAEKLNNTDYEDCVLPEHFTVDNEDKGKSYLLINFGEDIYFRVLTIYDDGHFSFDDGITYLNAQAQQTVVNYLAESN